MANRERESAVYKGEDEVDSGEGSGVAHPWCSLLDTPELKGILLGKSDNPRSRVDSDSKGFASLEAF